MENQTHIFSATCLKCGETTVSLIFALFVAYQLTFINQNNHLHLVVVCIGVQQNCFIWMHRILGENEIEASPYLNSALVIVQPNNRDEKNGERDRDGERAKC